MAINANQINTAIKHRNNRLRRYWWLLVFTVVLVSIFIVLTPSSKPPLPQPLYSTAMFDDTDAPMQTNKASFVDATLTAGIQKPHTQRSHSLSGLHESLGSGACAFDYDNDGWIDLLTLNGSGTTHFYGQAQWWQGDRNSLTLYRNNHDGTFKDVTKDSQLLVNSWTMGCANADLNNDGNEDIVISNYGENQLWRNNGDGTFTDWSIKSGITGDGWSTTVSIADINNDGLLDFYINNYIDFKTNNLKFEKLLGFKAAMPPNFNSTLYSGQANQLWLNQGNLTFTEHAASLGIDNAQGRSLSSHSLDIDGNAYPDLIVVNDKGSANKVYLNNGGTAFSDISTQSRLAFVDKASNINISDFNNDGYSDIFITTGNTLFPKLYTRKSTLEKESDYSFSDVSDHYQLHYSTSINQSHWGSITSDFNLDGWTDLFIANGIGTPDENINLIPRGQINTLLINTGNESFTNQNKSIAPDTYASFSSRCALSLDFDNNGAPDIYVTQNNGLGQLLENTSSDYQWIGFEVLSHGRTAYGAKVVLEKITGGKKTRIERSIGQSSFLCSGDQRVVFGLGNAPSGNPVDLEVIWSDGERTTFKNLARNHYHILRKGDKQSEILNYVTKDRSSSIRLADPQYKLGVTQWLIENGRPKLANSELRFLMQHTDPVVRLQAFTLSRQLPAIDQNAFTQIAINDTSKRLRLEAIRIIRDGENELLSRWLLKQLENSDADITCAAADSFSHFFDEEEAMLLHKYTALNSLIRLALKAEPKKQICAINALGRSEKYRALEPLISLLGSTEKDVRKASIQALGLLKDKAALIPLNRLFSDNGEAIENRAYALIAIKQISGALDINSLLVPKLEQSQSNAQRDDFLAAISYAYHEAENGILVRREILTFIAQSNLGIQFEQSNHVGSIAGEVVANVEQSCSQLESEQTQLSSQSIATFLNRCLSESRYYQIMPHPITLGLDKANPALHQDIFKNIASRKERWARALTMSALDDAQSSFEIQQTIIQNLPTPLSPSVLKNLKQRFITSLDSEVSPYIAKRLIQAGNADVSEAAFLLLESSLREGNESKTFGYAEALMTNSPGKVIDLLTKGVDQHVN